MTALRKKENRGSGREYAGIPSPITHHPSLVAQDQGAGRSGQVSPRTVLMTLLTILSLLSPPHKSEGACFPAALPLWGPLPCRILPVDSRWPRAPCQHPFARLSDMDKLPMPTVTLQ